MTVEYLPGALHEKLDFLFPPIKNTSEWNLDPKRFQNGVSRLSHQVPTTCLGNCILTAVVEMFFISHGNLGKGFTFPLFSLKKGVLYKVAINQTILISITQP